MKLEASRRDTGVPVSTKCGLCLLLKVGRSESGDWRRKEKEVRSGLSFVVKSNENSKWNA